MEVKKVELVKKILNSYIDVFEDCRESLIETVYDELGDTEWHTTECYGENYQTSVEECSISEIIYLINNSNSLKDLLEEVYDGSYTYEWYEQRYYPLLDTYLKPYDALDLIGMPYISTFIEKNYFKEFNDTFKEELDLSDDWESNGEAKYIDTCDYYDLIEDYLDSCDDDSYYVTSPEYIIEKWLEEEDVDTSRILKSILTEDSLKENSELVDSILELKSKYELSVKIEEICTNCYEDYLTSFIFKYIQQDLESSKDNLDIFNKKVYQYKSNCTVSDLIKSNEKFKKSLEEFCLINDNLLKSIKDTIFNSLSKNYILNNLTKIEDKDVKEILINSFGKEYMDNILKISDNELEEYLNYVINTFIKDKALHLRELLELDPYILYLKGAKCANKQTLYTIDKLSFEDEFLEQNFIDIYNGIANMYKTEINDFTIKDSDDVYNIINTAKSLINEELYDRPTRIELHLKNSKNIFKRLTLLSIHNNEYSDILNKLILLISKLEAYILLGEIGEEAYKVNYKEILNYKDCLIEIMKSDFRQMLKTVYVTENIKTQLKETLCENPKDEFPLARSIQRHFVINVGETNTGKTYNAIKRLKESKKGGVYLAPLRLLALEIQEKLNSEGIPCNLSTGEEEDFVEGAIHESLTVEKANFDKKYEVCVIDECQMIRDEQRGYAWTNAILGIYSKEIHLCVAPEALNLILTLINSCNDTYEVVEHFRKTPLILENKLYALPTKKSMQSLKKGDALIVFSKRQALAISAQLKSKGISASVIYGALPYQSRKKQFELFLNGETDIVVSTDALGMGVNLPIRRIVFLESKKFDGKKFRDLNHSEVKQISGRAGRQGLYNEGFVNTTENKDFFRRLLDDKTPEIKKATLLPPKSIIYINNRLLDTIKVWNKMSFPNLYKKGDTSRYIDILNRLTNYEDELSKEDMYNAITLPFDEKNQELYRLFVNYLIAYIDDILELDKPLLCDKPTLDDLEEYYKKLDLYYSFGKRFNMSIDLDWLKKEKDYTSLKINDLIINNIKNLKKRCPQCGKKLDFTWEHRLCDSCFHENNNYNWDYNWN